MNYAVSRKSLRKQAYKLLFLTFVTMREVQWIVFSC